MVIYGPVDTIINNKPVQTLTDKMDDIEIQQHQDRQITSPSPGNFITYANGSNITTENDATHGSPLVDWPRIWLQGVFICIFGVLGFIGNFKGYPCIDATTNLDT